MTQTLLNWTSGCYTILLAISWLALALVLLVLLPMALFRRLRAWSGSAIFYSSYLFGATTWLLGALVTFASYGWPGFIIGFLLLGVGVVPIGIFGAFFDLESGRLGVSLVVMLIVTYGARLVGAALISSAAVVDEEHGSTLPDSSVPSRDEYSGGQGVEHPGDTLDKLMETADKEARSGDYLEAIRTYKQINRFDPTRMEVYEALGETYRRAGLLAEAREQYEALAKYYERKGDQAKVSEVQGRLAELPDS